MRRQRSRKEERTVKCKSNDFHSIGRPAGSMLCEKSSTNDSHIGSQKLKIKTKNKSHQHLANACNECHSENTMSETVSNENLNNMYRQLIQEQSDEDFSSSDFLVKGIILAGRTNIYLAMKEI